MGDRYEDNIGATHVNHLVYPDHDFRCLHGMTAGADTKREIRLSDTEFVEEDCAHSRVVMLTCVQDHSHNG